ncbi:MAG: acetylglutamate kinase [Clostridia bacterium]|nr:acetylglutamate kinase [Clostridia bacterium]
MDLSSQDRAATLIEALPYIQKYYGKTIVVKYGGNAMISQELVEAVMSDIVMLSLVGVRVIVVHGGGPAINEMLDKIGHKTRKINGLRYTDQETMDVVQAVLCGQVNKDIVNMINTRGGHAIGLCGMDDHLIQARKLDKGDGQDYGLVGEITGIDPTIIGTTLMSDVIPVISTVAEGIDGNKCYNINADTAAAKIAAAVHAEKLILMTDVRGVLRDPKDEESLIHQILPMEIPYLEQEGVVSGGMIPKVECCADALENGVKRTHILDGRIPHAILMEMLTHKGIGTMIWKGDLK